MPKNHVTDPITDQEIASAHLLLSGKMNDREAAEAAGLSTTTAAYTKAKPRVRQYMDAHRAAVNEKLVDEEVQGLRKLNLGRDQILSRLWQLASLDPEVTKGSIRPDQSHGHDRRDRRAAPGASPRLLSEICVAPYPACRVHAGAAIRNRHASETRRPSANRDFIRTGPGHVCR